MFCIFRDRGSKKFIQRISYFFIISLFIAGEATAQSLNASAQQITSNSSSGQCDLEELTALEQTFDELASTLPANSPELIEIARLTMQESQECWATLYGNNKVSSSSAQVHIDDGPMLFDSIDQSFKVASFRTFNRKWGAGSPFGSPPGLPGGTVTYSFIDTGVSNLNEGGAAPNIRVSALSGIGGCFASEVTRAFAMWSAVANIQFRQVSDNPVPFNSSGTSANIRIGAHSADGPSGELAHAFAPPPNGNTAAGDIHFDTAEFWTCDTRGIDIGIVLTHETGHSIGLEHTSPGNVAIMVPFYSPAISTLRQNDIQGAVAIYGPAPGSVEQAPPPPTPPPPPPPPPAIMTPIYDLLMDDDDEDDD